MNNASEGEKHSSLTDEEDLTRLQQQTILEEVFTSDYNVTEEEVVEYCGVVGIDAASEPHLLPLAKAALLQPLPRPWTPVEDSRLGLYFFNQRTGESSWTHPVDALVRSLVARERTKNSCTDSCSEDIFTEEDLIISDLLKAQVNEADLTHSDCDVNNPSDYISTSLTSAKQCLTKSEKSDRNRSSDHHPESINESNSEESVKNSDHDINCDKNAVNDVKGKEKNTLEHPDAGDGCNDNQTKSDNNVIEKKIENVKNCGVLSISEKTELENYNVDSAVTPENTDRKLETNKTEGTPGPSDSASSGQKSPADDIECAQDPTMFSGRDGGPPGRGLGRSSHDPPPLGTPSPAGLPLGRPVLGSGPALGGAKVPPLGGQLTPLAPIAAASRGGHTQLAPLKPAVSAAHQHPASRDGRSDPLLRRQPTQKEEQGLGDGSQKQQTLKGERVPGGRRQVDNGASQGNRDSTLGSPPKSILKGPVMAHSRIDRASLQGVDRLLLTQPKETKNIRFDFKTDDLEFHSSEEDFEEEELEEEEEEEYDEEEEEEFDSEAEDPEEEAILRARGVIDDDSEGHGFMLNDASDLLSREPELPPQKLNPLPHGPDPWSNEKSLKHIPKERIDHRDPLKDFRSQKEENKTSVEKRVGSNGLQTPEQTQQKKVPVQTGQASGKDSQITPKSAVTQASGSNKPDTLESQAGKPKPLKPLGNSAQSTVTPVTKKSNEASDVHKALPQETNSDVKKNEVRPQEDRKLELEGAPKSRKTNPLDRVVAKLSGRTENKDGSHNTANTDIGKPASRASGTIKNLTVNLTEIMNHEEGESEEEESPNVDDSSSTVNKMDENNIHQKRLALSIQQEAEEKKLRDQHESDLKILREKLNKELQDMEKEVKRVQESDLKALREKLNKEYRDKEEQIRNEHKLAVQKFQEEEKKKLEQTIKQIQLKLGEEIKKDIENTKTLLQKENAEKKSKLIRDIEKVNNEEIEKIKLGYVQDMKEKKELMQKEHEEEMQELEQELQALYSKQKNTTQEELDAAKALDVTRRNNKSVAAAAVADMELSLAEVLRERQVDIKREHNKQLEILQDELDKELEKAARQAKEKETLEKKNHAAGLAKMKEEHEKEVRQLEELYEQNLNELETQHEEDLDKLKSDFKAELTVQKTELENKITELKIEYDQRMNHVDEDEMEGGEEGEEDRKSEEGMESNRKNLTPEERVSHNENVKRENRRLNEEERKYDQILRELRERRKSLEEDLQELKTQEIKVKELKNQKLTQSTSCCSEDVCIHESKYKKMKAKYSNLVNRIKSEKAKKSSKRLSATHEVSKISTQNSPSLSSDKSSLESNINVSDSGQPSSDMTSSIVSSPKHIRAQHSYHIKSTSDASEDEEIRLATQVLEKYNRIPKYSSTKNTPLSNLNGHLKHNFTKPMASTPKKAWLEDDLLVHGRKVLNETEKFLKSNHIKNHHEVMDLTAEDIKKNIIQQNADFRSPATKAPFHRLSLAHGGSVTSDTDSDEPTHDGPSLSSDFGLDQLLEKISSANKSSLGHRHQRSSQERIRPLRAAASLERGLNRITNPLNTYSSGYNTVSPAAPLRLEHLNTGSVPDLGPETVNRIASVNQYLQQKWTNYFGELSVPLGGKAGWPAQIIGQSTLLVNKNPAANFLSSNNQSPLAPGKRSSFVHDGDAVKSHAHKEDRNISQKIDDLRVWLENAQTATSALTDT